MSNNPGANQYKQMAVKTANRGQLLIMLYEAAILNVKKAIIALSKNEIATKGVCIGKAHDIVNELLNTLDFEVGGDIAKDLQQLYNFIIEQLLKANLENKPEPLESVKKILETLLSGWRVAVDQVNKSGGVQSTSPSPAPSQKKE